MATAAVFIALGGGAYAATTLPRGSVGPEQLQADAVSSRKVADHSLLAKDFRRGQLKAARAARRAPPGTAARPARRARPAHADPAPSPWTARRASM